ncbi:MAG: nucleoside hydrolase [Nocardioidaceae bacterium]
MRVHLDTDLGSDPDDVCAMAMLLGWPDVDVLGVTTSADPGGRRAGYAAHCLELAGRAEIPVVAGAGVSSSHQDAATLAEDRRYWPTRVDPRPANPGVALDLMRDSIDRGATVIAIGPYTNLALLAAARPGSLRHTSVVVMGGWIEPPDAGLPAWGPERDWNVQWDTRAAQIVAATAELTLSTLPVSLKTHLRAADLPALRALGPLGELIARQSEAHAADTGKADLGPAYPGLPDDLLNFHYDPLACAVALGWPGAVVEEMRLRTAVQGGVLRFERDEAGHRARVVVDVDGPGFSQAWLAAVAVACAG